MSIGNMNRVLGVDGGVVLDLVHEPGNDLFAGQARGAVEVGARAVGQQDVAVVMRAKVASFTVPADEETALEGGEGRRSLAPAPSAVLPLGAVRALRIVGLARSSPGPRRF
jgi:hypothetical protein